MGKPDQKRRRFTLIERRETLDPARMAAASGGKPAAADDQKRCKECHRVIKPKARFINGRPKWQLFCTDRPCKSRWHNKENKRLSELGAKAERERQARQG